MIASSLDLNVRDGKVEETSWITVVVFASYLRDSDLNKRVFIID